MPQTDSVEYSQEIPNWVEGISELFVLADPGDLQALGGLHTCFETLAGQASKDAQPRLAEIAQRTANLIEALVLREVPDPAGAMNTIAQCITALQATVGEGRDLGSGTFPAELDPEARPAPDLPDAASLLPPDVDRKILSDFLARQGGVLHDLEQAILAVEATGDEDSVAAVMRILHTLKGESGLLGMVDVERLCHKAEDACQSDGVHAYSDALLGVKDWLARTFVFFEGKGEHPEPIAGLLQELGAEAGAPPTAVPPAVDLLSPELATKQQGILATIESDAELVSEFISEAREHIENADVNLLTLETNPRDTEALNTVFRAFHTIKGVASFLSFLEIRSLAHEAEDLLDAARKGSVEFSGPAVDVTFEAVDLMKRLIDGLSHALETGEAPVPDSELPTTIERLSAVAHGQAPAPIPEAPRKTAAPDQPVGAILVKEGAADAADVEAALAKQKTGPRRDKLGAMLVESGATSRRRVEEALRTQQEQQEQGDGERDKLGRILVERGDATTVDVFNALNRQRHSARARKIGEILVRDGKASAHDVARALRDQTALSVTPGAGTPPPAKPSPGVLVREALKVDADRLDRLVDTIGELVIAESMVSQSPEVRDHASDTLQAHMAQLGKITRELQEMATALRMVPVRSTFQRMARLVRDVAKKAGKSVDFTMSGEDTELDKAVVDRIGDPLVHLIRNAVDHGIEASPEVRTRAGKTPAGRIWLRAYHRGGNIYVEVQDDGRGLDRDAILARGRERGLMGTDETPGERELLNLIFTPGFSTASEVTDVSGRGVGLDVVRKNIQLLRGEVDVQSEPGEGTTFVIRLPLTLAIIEGMIIHVGGERYIIPALSVVTAVRPASSDVVSVMHRREVLRLQGNLIPLFRLASVLDIEAGEQDPTQSIAVVVEYEGRRAALLTDALVGRQQIVIKSLGEALCDIPGIAGGAVMPDGRIGLILDIPGLVRLAETTEPQSTATAD